MGILQKKCRTTGKKALAYGGKGGQNTGMAFPALRLGVVLDLLNNSTVCNLGALSKVRHRKVHFHGEFLGGGFSQVRLLSRIESPVSSYRVHRCPMGFDAPPPDGFPL